MEKLLVLVDQFDCKKSSAPQLQPHQPGLLRRAFSIFIFDNDERVLRQQRPFDKFPSQRLWTISGGGHPRPGERTATEFGTFTLRLQRMCETRERSGASARKVQPHTSR
ncbi:NUDIX domain-containing protein [Pseudomonas nunensis]|uniref:NUDIX domain-containing protein n=1 Tax=Pseudomonas nunensis TaxID=2961896 RepID=UPI0006B4A315|nr:NUDIX domain-containing protein [Pseudomonas nunensis]